MDPKHLTLLRIHDACRGMSVEEVDMIAVEAEVVEAAAGKVIHIAGDTIDAIHIVVSGRLRMTAKTTIGGERTLRYISAGDQFGALMLFSEDDFPVDVLVDEKSILFRLDRESAERLIRTPRCCVGTC